MLKYKKVMNWSKQITVLRFIKLCRLLTAHYFHTVQNKYIKWAHKFTCIILGAFVLSVASYYLRSSFLVICVQFIISVLISLVTADDYLFRYFRATETLDVVMGIKSRKDNAVKLLALLLILIRIVFTCLNLFKGFSIYVFVSRLIVLISERVDCLIVIVIFYTLYTRIRILRRRIEKIPVPINIVNKNYVMTNIKEVRRCLLDYNNLLDNFHDVYQELQYLMSLIVFCCLPKNILFNYLIIDTTFSDSLQAQYISQEIEVLEAFVLVSLPSVLADLIRRDIDKMKRALSKQILKCSDESLRYELQIALDYVTRRPFNCMLFGAIPVDINVPIGIISLCITYVIIVMQFTHLNRKA